MARKSAIAHSRYDPRSPGHDSSRRYCGPMWASDVAIVKSSMHGGGAALSRRREGQEGAGDSNDRQAHGFKARALTASNHPSRDARYVLRWRCAPLVRTRSWRAACARVPIRRNLDENEAAVYLSLSPSFFRKLIAEKRMPLSPACRRTARVGRCGTRHCFQTSAARRR